jgi:hypothetical protein
MSLRKTKKRLSRLRRMIRAADFGSYHYWRLMSAAMVEDAKLNPSFRDVIYRNGKLVSIMAKPYTTLRSVPAK